MVKSTHTVITDTHRALFLSEKERTGLGIRALLKRSHLAPPDDLKGTTADAWMKGVIKTAPRTHIAWVIDAYSQQPDTNYMRITAEHVTYLHKLCANTGCGPLEILYDRESECPEGLHRSTLLKWRSGKAKTARIDHWNWYTGLFESYDRNPVFVPLTDDIIQTLQDEIERTQLLPETIMRKTTKTRPLHLKATTVENWFKTQPERIRKAHLDFVLGLYGTHKDNTGQLKRPISPEDRDYLSGLMKELDLGISQILRLVPKPLPKGLSANAIKRWLDGTHAHVRTRPWQAVIDTLERVKTHRSSRV